MLYALLFILGSVCGVLCFAVISYDQTMRLQHQIIHLKSENQRLKQQVINLSKRHEGD